MGIVVRRVKRSESVVSSTNEFTNSGFAHARIDRWLYLKYAWMEMVGGE